MPLKLVAAAVNLQVRHCLLMQQTKHHMEANQTCLMLPLLPSFQTPTTDAEAHAKVRSEHEVLPLWLCMATVLLLVFISSAVWLAMVPSILIW
jgi:hypothetical protein